MPAPLILGAIAVALSQPGAAAGDKALRAYPAMQHQGAAYAVNADKANRIAYCLPLDPSASADTVRTACAALAAKGVPADIVPAVAKGSPDEWFPSSEYPAEAMPAKSTGTVTLIYEIDTRGAATNCMIYRSSGIRALDVAACAALTKRARFTPASYKGKPVHAAAISSFGFDSY